ncbi:hypothetical protein TNCV_3034051 [Trichonephila clavipes]|nr:hypothetical protein TNCV_3034051 [Trichonephila clavipes]
MLLTSPPRPIQQRKKSLITGRLFTVKSKLPFNGRNKANAVSASDSIFMASFEKNPFASYIMILFGFSTNFQKSP